MAISNNLGGPLFDIEKIKELMSKQDYTQSEKRLLEHMMTHQPNPGLYGGAKTGRFSHTMEQERQQASVLEAERAFHSTSCAVIELLKRLETVNMDQGARDLMEEIIIGQFAMKLAQRHGDAFDSFRFYAKCKGKTE